MTRAGAQPVSLSGGVPAYGGTPSDESVDAPDRGTEGARPQGRALSLPDDGRAVTDGAHGKPWVFRYKDLKAWWGSQHFNRPGGIEAGSPMRGCRRGSPCGSRRRGSPAVDKGANQPNVFPDPKSSASAVPYYSTGVRDDLGSGASARRCCPTGTPATRITCDASNPVSTVYGERMVRHGAHPSLDVGRAAVPGLPRISSTSGATARTGTPGTG